MRFIDPRPRLANALNERLGGVLADDTREWIAEWVGDVGKVVRSRDFAVSAVITIITSVVLGV